MIQVFELLNICMSSFKTQEGVLPIFWMKAQKEFTNRGTCAKKYLQPLKYVDGHKTRMRIWQSTI
jgi:hypothetical protein